MPGREGVLVGLGDGSVLKVYVDNAFPIDLVSGGGGGGGSAVRCLDVSRDKKLLAVVDSEQRVRVWDLKARSVIWQGEGGNAAVFNSEIFGFNVDSTVAVVGSSDDRSNDRSDDHSTGVISAGGHQFMLSFTGASSGGGGSGGTLTIKTGTPSLSPSTPVCLTSLPSNGFVVGFAGSVIHTLVYSSLCDSGGSYLSSIMNSLITAGDYAGAYTVGTGGVTDGDWKALGLAAVKGHSYTVAKKAFVRVRETRSLALVKEVEGRMNGGERGGRDDNNDKAANKSNNLMLASADIFAFTRDYTSAAKLYAKAGDVRRAIDLYADLKKWEEAKVFATGVQDEGRNEGRSEGSAPPPSILLDLTRRQADDYVSTPTALLRNWKEAAKMFIKCGDIERAVSIIGDTKGECCVFVCCLARQHCSLPLFSTNHPSSNTRSHDNSNMLFSTVPFFLQVMVGKQL